MSTSSGFLVSGWENDEQDVDEEQNPHDTPEKEILWAAENGKLDVLETVLKKNPGLLNFKDSDGYTPLHRACSANQIEVVQYLLMEGADIASQTEMNWQPLHSCCQWNHTKIAALLIQAGADVNATSEGLQTPLHIAATHGTCYDMVQLLLIHPYIKPDMKNNSGETAKDIAMRSSKYYNIFEMVDPIIQGICD